MNDSNASGRDCSAAVVTLETPPALLSGFRPYPPAVDSGFSAILLGLSLVIETSVPFHVIHVQAFSGVESAYYAFC